MAIVTKPFDLIVDIKKPVTNEPFEITEGDTGNTLSISIQKDGVPVDLTGCLVMVIFSHSEKTFEQDNESTDGDVTIGGENNNIVTISLHSSSYAPNGITECEIKITSGENREYYITTPPFNIQSRRALLSDETITSVVEFPILLDLITRVEGLTIREQSDWNQTDNTLGSFIRNKPVAGINFIDAIQNLTEENAIVDADSFVFLDASASAHRKSTFSNIIAKIRSVVFGSTTGLAKLDGAGNVSAGVANTDFAAATHASRHSVGGVDALSGYEKERVVLTNQSVGTSGWATYTASGTEETAIYSAGYVYRKSLDLSGVLSTMFVRATLSADADLCGTTIWKNINPYDGGIKIYAKSVPTNAFTILSVNAWKAVG